MDMEDASTAMAELLRLVCDGTLTPTLTPNPSTLTLSLTGYAPLCRIYSSYSLTLTPINQNLSRSRSRSLSLTPALALTRQGSVCGDIYRAWRDGGLITNPSPDPNPNTNPGHGP